jgi:hypothetical protein
MDYVGRLRGTGRSPSLPSRVKDLWDAPGGNTDVLSDVN